MIFASEAGEIWELNESSRGTAWRCWAERYAEWDKGEKKRRWIARDIQGRDEWLACTRAFRTLQFIREDPVDWGRSACGNRHGPRSPSRFVAIHSTKSAKLERSFSAHRESTSASSRGRSGARFVRNSELHGKPSNSLRRRSSTHQPAYSVADGRVINKGHPSNGAPAQLLRCSMVNCPTFLSRASILVSYSRTYSLS
jgi:hypothetical protein